jgi:hypothetical protein
MRFFAIGLVLLVCACACAGKVSRPALTVRVVDSASRQPIPGIPVAYAVEVYVWHPRLLGIIPRPDPTLGRRLVRKMRGSTDAKGEVVFEVRDIRLTRDEEVSGELVIVNVGVDGEHEMARAELKDLEQLCRTGSPLCPDGTPDDIDVILGATPDSDWRRDVLHAGVERHRGRILLIHPVLVESRPPPQADEEVTFVDHLSSRQKPEVLLVALDRLP